MRASPGRGRGQTLGSETPVHPDPGPVPLVLPHLGLLSQYVLTGNPVVQTLPHQHAKLYLGPRPPLGQAIFSQLPCFGV